MAEVIMSSVVYEAAIKGDVGVLKNGHNYNFESHTLEEKNTILHLAIKNDKNGQNRRFIEEVITRFPTLLCKPNSKGDTALHVSARLGKNQITQFLVSFFYSNNNNIHVNNAANNGDEPLWRIKNKEGDTPLHVALKRGKIEVALLLINLDDGSLESFINNSQETPLHLAIRLGGSDSQQHLLSAMLVWGASSAVSMRDADGLTPLLRAACLRNSIPIISTILSHNPQLAEQRDLQGRTILHLIKLHTYEEGRNALEIPGIIDIKDDQDSDGNTPLHLAIKDSDFIKVRILMECSADFTINNSHGISSWDLIQLQDEFPSNMPKKPYMEAIPIVENRQNLKNGLMKKELYSASVKGDVDFLSQHDDIYFLSRSVEGNNILHIALGQESDDKREFVKAVLERFPILLCQSNNNGDNPLHFAARRSTLSAFELLRSCKDTFDKVLQSNALYLRSTPWRARNLEGNTPLHEALRVGNAIFARFLIQLDDEVARYVNNSSETPLHICTRYKQEDTPFSLTRTNELANIWPDYAALTRTNELDLLLEANISAAFLRDVDGLTPLLRAAQCRHVEKVIRILDRCPRSVEVCDFDGRTVLHHITLGDKHEERNLLEIPAVVALARVQDYGGNTPLHLAIKRRHFYKVEVLASISSLSLTNNDGELPFDLIRSQTEVPQKIRMLLRPKSSELSLYGISEVATRDNVNTLLVISVLLSTITFAAAFQVPGGLDGKTGFPTLLTNAAFKVFIISDAYAMCCSMLVLFSLIWVMTKETVESVKLIDLSVFFLQQSFYATTLAFMTGVYVTISQKELWIAILVCTLCSALMICSLKPVNLFLSRIFPLVPDFLKTVAGTCVCLPCIPFIPCLVCCFGSMGSDTGRYFEEEEEEHCCPIC